MKSKSIALAVARSVGQKSTRRRRILPRRTTPPGLSSLAAVEENNNAWDVETTGYDRDIFPKHCTTCTCSGDRVMTATRQSSSTGGMIINHQEPPATSHSSPSKEQQQNETTTTSTLPPPLPAPTYSVRRRVLPETLCALNSHPGRQFLLEALQQNMAAPYLTLTEHFCNQSDPAYCGVTTLMMVLNSLAIDPHVRWKGGWRYFGNEDVLLGQCCLEPDRIRRIGIQMEEFAQLGTCQGLSVVTKRAVASEEDKKRHVDEFRNDLMSLLREDEASLQPQGILVASFSRAALGQTGDGHFSPVAAYHAETDQVLILDVARFKYQPYWVSVADLYHSMCPLDEATGKSRGWFLLYPPQKNAGYKGQVIRSEERRPAELVPQLGDKPLCPLHQIKIDFCRVSGRWDDERETY